MNVETGTEAARFPGKEHINVIFVAVLLLNCVEYTKETRSLPLCHLPSAETKEKNFEFLAFASVSVFVRGCVLFVPPTPAGKNWYVDRLVPPQQALLITSSSPTSGLLIPWRLKPKKPMSAPSFVTSCFHNFQYLTIY